MAQIRIDADALYRAITATGYKLMAYHLDLTSGEIISRTLRPDEVTVAPQAPSVKPLPKMGGDLEKKKGVSPFDPPVSGPKKKLFNDDDGPKKPAFEGDFFKRDEKKKVDPFGDGGFKKESGTKKLAEMFGEPAPKKKVDPFAGSEKKDEVAVSSPLPLREGVGGGVPDSPPLDPESHPRIPVATEAQQAAWKTAFAKDCGDPQIRDELQHALASIKPVEAFERVLRKFARLTQQWEHYHRKQALALAESWLATFPLTYEIVEKE
ncbi:MAG TPA: hypothetical protein VEJ63_05635 [Planctomycetota bacterium]|nr:hypothetical protein [Planctomycetota bacterium]